MTEPTQVDLESLAGIAHRFLSGVDFVAVKNEESSFYEDATHCRFILDGMVYTAVEDPSDGYRSCMSHLLVGGDTSEVTTRFPSVEVVLRHSTKRRQLLDAENWHGDEDCDLLEFFDVFTGKVILTIGTDRSDDYYPSFVANFRPENMSINSEVMPVETASGDEPNYDDNEEFGLF